MLLPGTTGRRLLQHRSGAQAAPGAAGRRRPEDEAAAAPPPRRLAAQPPNRPRRPTAQPPPQEVEPIKVHGAVVACYGSEDPTLGAPVSYLSLKGTSYDKPAVCKYTGLKYYSDDWMYAH